MELPPAPISRLVMQRLSIVTCTTQSSGFEVLRSACDHHSKLVGMILEDKQRNVAHIFNGAVGVPGEGTADIFKQTSNEPGEKKKKKRNQKGQR